MRCLACNEIISDLYLKIEFDLCPKCFAISMDAVREMEVEDLKEDNKNGKS